MNLTITDDMTIKFISGGVEHVIDKLIYNENNVDYTVYDKETEIDWSQEYLCFESLEDGNTIHFDCKYGVTPSFASWFAWSKDKTTWHVTNVTDGDDDISVSLDKGEKVYFKGELPNGGSWRNGDYGAGYDGLSRFYGDKKFNVMGNLMSMCYGDNFLNQNSLSSFGDNVFSHFFLGSAGDYDANPTTTMIDIRNLYLPATTLTYNECYSGIFRSNAGLLYPPKSISVDDTQTVGLYGLFLRCTSLEESPILSWSSNGFYGVLDMFTNCSSLKRIAAIGSTSEDYWTENVHASGIFYKNSNASWSSGTEGIPSGWTTRNWNASTIRVIDAELPVVYAGYVKGLTRLAQDGDSITLQYMPLNGYTFNGWYLNGSLVSSSNPYTFTVSGNATFEVKCNTPAQYNVTVSSNDNTMGTASGGGTYWSGTSVTLTATKNTGYRFVGWYESGSLVSSSASYTFTVTGNRTLVATFEVSTSSYTEVSCIKMSNPQTYGGVSPLDYDHVYFNTGIKINKDLTWRCKFSILGSNGGAMIGEITYSDDNADYRVFCFDDTIYFDNCNRRITSFGLSGLYGTMLDFTFGNMYYHNNDSGNTYSSSTANGSLSNSDFVISMNTIKFHELWIWGTDGVTLLFHGLSVLDSNNVPCIYDYVSDDYIYPIYQNNTSACGTLTYEA